MRLSNIVIHKHVQLNYMGFFFNLKNILFIYNVHCNLWSEAFNCKIFLSYIIAQHYIHYWHTIFKNFLKQGKKSHYQYLIWCGFLISDRDILGLSKMQWCVHVPSLFKIKINCQYIPIKSLQSRVQKNTYP